MGLFHNHEWRNATSPGGQLVKACRCGKIKLRCERYPYGRDGVGTVLVRSHCICNCDQCIDERKPLTLNNLTFDE